MKKRIIAWLLGMLSDEGYVLAFGKVWAVVDIEMSHNNSGRRSWVNIRGVTLREEKELVK